MCFICYRFKSSHYSVTVTLNDDGRECVTVFLVIHVQSSDSHGTVYDSVETKRPTIHVSDEMFSRLIIIFFKRCQMEALL